MTAPAQSARIPLVLVVDDSARNRKLVVDVLRSAGFRTLDAASGHEAVVTATEQAPDLILLDLQLPDIDGREVARRLRAADRTSSIPVVAFSATRVEGSAWLADDGFAGLIDKPIDIVAFPEQVRGFLGHDP